MTVFRRAADFHEALADLQGSAAGLDFIRRVGELRLEPDWTYPEDPLGEAYHRSVLEHFEEVAGRPYEAPAANESFDVPLQAHLRAPYPHCTGDSGEVSRYLMGVATIIRAIDAAPPRRIVEFGSGWGHVAMHLARMGHDVSAIDINVGSANLLRERARRNEVPLDVRNEAYLDAAFPAGSIDAAIFFESFHHCHRPFDLLARLERWLAPGGILVLSAEPIHAGFHAPWDVRLDGQALWAAREHGWLELGFEESFFVKTLMRRGWIVAKARVDAAGPYGVVHVARRHEGEFLPGHCYLPPDEASKWAPHDPLVPDALRWTAGSSGLPLDSDLRWRGVKVEMTNFNPRRAHDVALACGESRAAVRIEPGAKAEVSLALPPAAPRDLVIESPTWVPRDEGVNQDARSLGVAVGRITYREDPA